MRTTDFSPLYRTIVGFDRLADMIDTAAKQEPGAGYPPYNIEQLGEHEYRIELAVAGFGEEDLDIQVQENVLTISGKRAPSEGEDRNFLHRGIAERSFERRFHLADNVEVRGADLRNGLLQVRLEREIPEAKKPRQISINGKSGTKLIQGGKADAA
ncbi:Hsp20 family protein [Maricaulaceae bacterium EIL42A08]|nr:Hsp20 family protein [Maricaulaceae bacterium EIL42A08]